MILKYAINCAIRYLSQKTGMVILVVMSIEIYERQLTIVDVYQKPHISNECTLQRRSSQLYRKRNLSGREFQQN